MNAPTRAHPESPEPHEPDASDTRFAPGPGFCLPTSLQPAAERARAWAGDGLRALILSGSHATGEAVWTELDGRRVSLSDLDLYAVLRDEAACDVARARAAASRATAERDALAWGLAAPLEVAFVTLEGLRHMPARPGTVDLARSGRVLAGDASILAALPHWEPAAVSAEERLLLLENRAFELLWASRTSGMALATLRARHAVLKTALDLAALRTLRQGELPAGAAARVARARELGEPAGLPSWLQHAWGGVEQAWQEGLAWREGAVRALGPAEAMSEWRAVVRAWSAVWWAERESADAPRDPWDRALAAAARAPLARRVRRSLTFRAPDAVAVAGALTRLRHAVAGTPEHRIHGSATVLMLAAAQSAHEPRLPAGALHALAQLGVSRALGFETAALDTLRSWDRELHAGLRTAGAS